LPGKILIVDDVATNRIVLKVKLAAAHYDTLQAATGPEALAAARSHLPGLILLDIELPGMDGIAVCRALKSDPATRHIPVVMITAFHDTARRIEALGAGAEDVLWKPVDEQLLLARLRSLIRAREARAQLGLADSPYGELGLAEPAAAFDAPGTVGLIAAQADIAIGWKSRLAPHLSDRLIVLDREAALSDLDEGAVPDVFVVAADLPRPGDGLRFLSELRSRHLTRHAAICLVLPPGAREASATALDLGASDLIETGVEPAEMALRIRSQIRRKKEADRLRSTVADGLRLSVIDPLTGLHNRRYAFPQLARIAERAGRGGREFAVLLLDLDRFKAVNDTWGHAAGDTVLAEVARRLTAGLRPTDMVARIGGEEFLAVLPETGFRTAMAVAERLRRSVSGAPVRTAEALIPVTLSIGLAMGGGAEAGAAQVDTLLARADQALLAAKSDGRNQVTVHRSAA
jgi:two-component system cell cycle response regulator